MSVSSSSATTSVNKTWQERLEGRHLRRQVSVETFLWLTHVVIEYCHDAQIAPPVFQLLSDRRGRFPSKVVFETEKKILTQNLDRRSNCLV